MKHTFPRYEGLPAVVTAVVGIFVCVVVGCRSRSVVPIPPAPVSPKQPSTVALPMSPYQRLLDSIGDRCYPGDQFPMDVSVDYRAPVQDAASVLERRADSGTLRNQQRVRDFLSTFFPEPAQTAGVPKKRAISSVEDLALLSDIELAKFKNDELIVIGPPARAGEGFRPDDWYTVFRAIAGAEAPGVTIDPGPNRTLMQVRYFGGIERTALGGTFFEADRTLKLLSTGFDNVTCAVWPDRPQYTPTELDLISAEIGDGSSAMEGEGHWHRFWFEPSENPIETEGTALRIPKDRLIVKDESIPAGLPSPKSARQFAAAISARFLGMSNTIRPFSDLQRDAALVILAKWMRDKQIPADEEWVKGTPAELTTPTTTPSITVLRARATDQVYLRYGIHGGVDFQKENRYMAASPLMSRLIAIAERSGSPGATSWSFYLDGQPYRAVRLKIRNPIEIRPHWVIWQRVVTRILVQPKLYRVIVPQSNFVVTNDTGDTLTIRLVGPPNKTESVGAGVPTVVPVIPGSYRLKITTRCGDTDDAVTVAAGERHQLRYWCTPTPTPTPPPARVAYLVVTNDTGEALTIEVSGPVSRSERVPARGSPSQVEVTPGSYRLKVTTRCGTTADAVTVTEGDRHQLRYWCEPTRAPAPPEQTGVGYFVVNNNTGAALTVSVGGLSYTVQPGTSTIRLSSGYYIATISSQCGTATETLTVANGSTYTGQYSCVRQ